MKVLIAAVVVALIHGTCATLIIKGPTEPVLEGDSVILECQLLDSEYNISQVRFEAFYKYTQRWTRISSLSFTRGFWCNYYRDYSEQPEDNNNLLHIRRAWKYSGGPYRCVLDSTNATAPDNASEPLSFPVHYLDGLSLIREGYNNYLHTPHTLSVRAGSDVVINCSASSSEEPIYFWYREGDDWVLPSTVLTLKKVSASNAGDYTCSAQHPFISSLIKKRTISITVLREDAPWYQTSDGQVILMTLGAVAICLVVIVSLSVFLCRRAKKFKNSKGPIDDRSQKKPIYKSSAESLPITCGDEQPLV